MFLNFLKTDYFIKKRVGANFRFLTGYLLFFLKEMQNKNAQHGFREFVKNNLPILAILFPLLYVDLFLNNSLFLE
jgi:hypothetical protein